MSKLLKSFLVKVMGVLLKSPLYSKVSSCNSFAYIFLFSVWMAIIRLSIILVKSSLSCNNNRLTTTFFFWPYLHARAIAWSSLAGFQSGVVKYIRLKFCKLSPTEPALIWIKTISILTRILLYLLLQNTEVLKYSMHPMN